MMTLIMAVTSLLVTSDTPSPKDFTVLCRVRVTHDGAGFPALVTDKDWDGGEIRDYTTHHELGRSRTTGKKRGFALALQPGGAWTWNVGDGKSRRDYRPTAPRQTVNDGQWHRIGFSWSVARKECRLYHDGRIVAVYCVSGMGPLLSGDAPRIGTHFGSEEVQLRTFDRVLTPSEVAAFQSDGAPVPDPKPAPFVETFKVLAWNIWHGGRRDGNEVGLQKTVECIRESGADLVLMQETYGSGAAIADALDFHFYLRSSNLSVMSRYPIRETFDLYQGFRFGGAIVELSPGQRLKAFSLWIHYLPSIGKQMVAEKVTPESLIAAENETRGKEIRDILKTLAPHLESDTPIIVAGDFNSPSHLDWTRATAGKHRDLVVDWPVSRAMAEAGFHDSFRLCHPDPVRTVGRTWSPRFTESYSMRIDYVYHRGDVLQAVESRMIDTHAEGWPSDHAAVLTTYRWKK